MSQQITTCKNCGAPLDIRQGDAMAYCTYCGEVHQLRDLKDNEEHYMLGVRLGREQIRNALLGDLLKVPGVKETIYQSLQITKAELVYLPYYVTQVHGNLRWSGLGRQANYSFPYKGAYRHISFHTEPESGIFDDQVSVTKYAGNRDRSQLASHDISPIGRKYFDRGEIDAKGGIIDEPEMNFQDAAQQAKEYLEQKHQALLNEELEVLEETESNYQLGQNQLFHVPMWFINWKISAEGDTYSAIIDASSGITVSADTPRSKGYLLMAFGIGLLYLLVGLIPYIFLSLPSSTEWVAIVTMLVGLVFLAQTWYKNMSSNFKESGT